ncbi:MAG: hypothetical protein EB101_07035 [Chitinophagia bacterium]|nr:hypothetical protein [Chitinophagia bacterium]
MEAVAVHKRLAVEQAMELLVQQDQLLAATVVLAEIKVDKMEMQMLVAQEIILQVLVVQVAAAVAAHISLSVGQMKFLEQVQEAAEDQDLLVEFMFIKFNFNLI